MPLLQFSDLFNYWNFLLAIESFLALIRHCDKDRRIEVHLCQTNSSFLLNSNCKSRKNGSESFHPDSIWWFLRDRNRWKRSSWKWDSTWCYSVWCLRELFSKSASFLKTKVSYSFLQLWFFHTFPWKTQCDHWRKWHQNRKDFLQRDRFTKQRTICTYRIQWANY